MLFDPQHPLMNAIIIYLIIIIIIVLIKPNFIYNKHKQKFKEFSFDVINNYNIYNDDLNHNNNDYLDDKTLLSFPILSVIIAVLSYIICVYIKNFNELKKNYERFTENKV